MKPHRLILTQEQTDLIRKHGMRFAVASPLLIGTTGLAVLNLIECDRDTANAACGVAGGTHAAVRLETPPPTAPPPPAGFCGQ